MSGFGRVNVLFFFDGSIGVQVAVTFDSTSTATQEVVQNAFDQGVTSGDLLMNSEYKLTPSKSQVIEGINNISNYFCSSLKCTEKKGGKEI